LPSARWRQKIQGPAVDELPRRSLIDAHSHNVPYLYIEEAGARWQSDWPQDSGQGGWYRIPRSTWLMSAKSPVFRVTRMNP
jgi:hypothetical protein